VRKLSYLMMVSLDGFIETPSKELDWAIIDEELHTFVNERADAVGTFLYGRVAYEGMAEFWPTADANPEAPPFEAEFSRIWKEKPKVVFSSTPEEVEWNSRLVKGDAVEEVRKLKEEPGEGGMVVGGAGLSASLIEEDLIDEYLLFIHPVVIGGGTPLFPALDERLSVRLVETRAFGSGVAFLDYERVRE
jgi:dihydrofolate reductase